MTDIFDSDGSLLERRARNLLRAYPPGYRAARGEEILGTLLDATPPGRTWPPAREVASVIRGGLSARRTANQREGVAASLRQAAILGATLYLAVLMSNQLWIAYQDYHGPVLLLRETRNAARDFLPLLPLAAALTAAWSGRRWLTAVSAVVAGAIYSYYTMHDGYEVGLLFFVLLALAALVLFTRSGQRLPNAWLWLPGLVAGLDLLDALAPFDWRRAGPGEHVLSWLGGWTADWGYSSPHFLEIMAVVCVCWLVTDVRPLAGLAFGFVTEAELRIRPAYPAGMPYWMHWALTAAPLLVVLVLALLLRRRLRASPPGIG